MKLLSFVLLLVSIFLPTLALAQAQQQDWVPSGIEALGQNASSPSNFTLNHSMLVLASKLDKNDDGNLRPVIAGVNGVSVHSYRFSQSGTYDPTRVCSDSFEGEMPKVFADGLCALSSAQPGSVVSPVISRAPRS
jgi:hypothetical protein